MIFYHGTSKENWNAIQREGVLFNGRVTYLAVDMEEAKCYGNVVLQVEYDPTTHPNMNNYVDGCWQFRVYEPITIENIKVMEEQQ